jgi:hypothetical protein
MTVHEVSRVGMQVAMQWVGVGRHLSSFILLA